MEGRIVYSPLENPWILGSLDLELIGILCWSAHFLAVLTYPQSQHIEQLKWDLSHSKIEATAFHSSPFLITFKVKFWSVSFEYFALVSSISCVFWVHSFLMKLCVCVFVVCNFYKIRISQTKSVVDGIIWQIHLFDSQTTKGNKIYQPNGSFSSSTPCWTWNFEMQLHRR
jgi:hypothetical protein